MPSNPIQIGTLETKLTWFMTPVGLLIDEVTVSGGPLTIDQKSLRESTGELEFEAIVRNQSIAVFLEKLKPAGLHSFEVAVQADGVHVKAVKTVLLPIPATAHAILKLDENGALAIELISAEAMGAGLKSVVASQLAEMNHLVEADMFPVPVEFREVIHEEGQVRVLGIAKLS